MDAHDNPDLIWRKSSHSDNKNGACVEIALCPSNAAVRDSKDPAAGHLSLSAGAWRGFLETIGA